jgi:hypothetical protein
MHVTLLYMMLNDAKWWYGIFSHLNVFNHIRTKTLMATLHNR